jgi:hypothetical protein
MYKPYVRSTGTSVAKMYWIGIPRETLMNQIERRPFILLKQHIR